MSSKYDVEKSNQISTRIDESKYTCCCGSPVILCAKLWLRLLLILSVINIIIITKLIDKEESNDLAQWVEHNQHFILGAVINIPLAIVSAMSLYGIYKKQPNWLWPFIIYLLIGIISTGIHVFHVIVEIKPVEITNSMKFSRTIE
uniref:Uncharacterized protein n=1 Tax=Acrobeloides nanus TaxID=290746 RepID=A0A914DKW5_9BILA